MNTPTPETDAAVKWRFGGEKVEANFARKLERERDEAKNLLKQDDVGIAGMKLAISDLRTERDELLKVCDALVSAGCFEERYWSDCGCPSCKAFASYKELPHIKLKSK